MGPRNAVVVSQKTIAKLLGITDRSVRTAVALLEEERWIQVVQLNGPGTVSAYVVNSVVGWSQSRENLHTAAFTATVIADAEDQKNGISHRELRQIPMLYPFEQQLPSGPGEEPPAQPGLEGLEPDLPSLTIDKE
jgi:DNA-binding transcriptional regulator LsrR (DeoR family)